MFDPYSWRLDKVHSGDWKQDLAAVPRAGSAGTIGILERAIRKLCKTLGRRVQLVAATASSRPFRERKLFSMYFMLHAARILRIQYPDLYERAKAEEQDWAEKRREVIFE